MRDGAHQLAIDIDRAAAHALHDAGMFQGTAGEARQDQRFLGPDVIQDAEDLDLELFDAVSPENTVRPMPRMPGRTSFSGKNGVCAARAAASARAAGTTKRST